ncbi:MAG: dihydrodipicolinate reductase, partial [Dehalococcoidia bacterium]|nr:dihydrodipicolinate reductase [Dehalococcoidia bacterium]
RARVEAGRFGHVGLQESCWLVAESVGWRLDTLEERIEPVLASDRRVLGIRQTAEGTLAGRKVIEAVVLMSSGADRPRDEIAIEGTAPVRMVIEGGVPGDAATAAVLVNALPRVVEHGPGLITMLDLPIVSGRGATR